MRKIIGILTTIVIIIVAIIYFSTQDFVPSLMPFLLALLMGIAFYDNYKGNKNEEYRTFTLILLTVACILNFIVGIIQFVDIIF